MLVCLDQIYVEILQLILIMYFLGIRTTITIESDCDALCLDHFPKNSLFGNFGPSGDICLLGGNELDCFHEFHVGYRGHRCCSPQATSSMNSLVSLPSSSIPVSIPQRANDLIRKASNPDFYFDRDETGRNDVVDGYVERKPSCVLVGSMAMLQACFVRIVKSYDALLSFVLRRLRPLSFAYLV